MVANSHKNLPSDAKSQNRSTADQGRSYPGRSYPGRSYPGRSYPGLGRLDTVQDSVRHTLQHIANGDLLDWTYPGETNAPGDGASESVPKNLYQTFLFPVSSARTTAGSSVNEVQVRKEQFESQEDLLEDVYHKVFNQSETDLKLPILIFEPDFHEAAVLSRKLEMLGQQTYLSSSFSKWADVVGKLGSGKIDVLVSTTLEIPLADQIAWSTIYLPSSKHLSPNLDASGWLGKVLLSEMEPAEELEVVFTGMET